MKKFYRRLLTLIMAVIMVVGSLPATTLAATKAGNFTDVDSNDYFYNPVKWAIEKKVTSGTTATTFSPKDDCTRGQIVTFLYKAGNGSPFSNAKTFSDVKKGKYYYDPVSWAVSKNITSGTSSTTFSPNQSCTRAQAVTFLWRFAGSPNATTSKFIDVKEGKYYYTAVSWAVSKGITAGTSETEFSPNQICTRAQIVTFLYKSFENNDKNNKETNNQSSSKSEKNIFTVTFNLNYDGKNTTIRVKEGNTVKKPEAPIRTGFEFKGWYKEDGEEYNFDTAVNSNITLTAKWEVADLDDVDLDSDKDGLPNYYEKNCGTDPAKLDTDGDGLTDFQEIVLETDPLITNTYDETTDMDGDGLTDIEESKVGSNPKEKDTDYDGLNDYDEIKKYHTDPTNEDTDGDGLNDEFEVEHGLDPLKLQSDGVTDDSEREIEQELPTSAIALSLKKDTNNATPSISGKAKGEMDSNLFLASYYDAAFDDNRAVVGDAVNVDADSDYVRGLTLSFNISSYEGDKKSLSIIRLNDDGTFKLIGSDLGEENISTTLTENGIYAVLDVDSFLANLDINLGYLWKNTSSAAKRNSFWDEDDESGNANTNKIIVDSGELDNKTSDEEIIDSVPSNNKAKDKIEVKEFKASINKNQLVSLDSSNTNIASSASGQADIVFAIDTTGSMSDTINNVVTNITSFVNSLSDNYNVKVNFALVDFKDIEEDGPNTTVVVKNGSSNWFSDADEFKSAVSNLRATGGGDTPECDIDALETARMLDFRGSVDKFVVLITDTYYKNANNYGIESLNQEIEYLQKSGIAVSVVAPISYQNTYKDLFEKTGGIFADISSSEFSTSLLQLANKIGEKTADGRWVILRHGYKYVKITDENDQDDDGIPTEEELGSSRTYDLNAFVKFLLKTHGVSEEAYIGQTTVTLHDATSDPTVSDSDSDGIPDGEDDAPWTKGKKDGSIGEIYLIATKGNAATTIVKKYISGGDYSTGHSFLIYDSYVKETLDLSHWNGGYRKNGSTWLNPIVDKTAVSEYSLSPHNVLAFSAGGDENIAPKNGDGYCAVYNMEFRKNASPNYGFSYMPNEYYISKVKQSQFDKMLVQMNEEGEKSYNFLTHQCTHVSLGVWNKMFGKHINPVGLNTPTNLYSWLSKNDGYADFDISLYTGAYNASTFADSSSSGSSS